MVLGSGIESGGSAAAIVRLSIAKNPDCVVPPSGSPRAIVHVVSIQPDGRETLVKQRANEEGAKFRALILTERAGRKEPVIRRRRDCDC
jgi:hypothetical protein